MTIVGAVQSQAADCGLYVLLGTLERRWKGEYVGRGGVYSREMRRLLCTSMYNSLAKALRYANNHQKNEWHRGNKCPVVYK